MYFSTSRVRERSAYFDQWQQETHTVLARPGVQTRLGELGRLLIQQNADAFLPNVRFSRVHVPESYRSTGRVAVLPVLPEDTHLKPGRSLLEVTPRRLTQIQNALDIAGQPSDVRSAKTYAQKALSNKEAAQNLKQGFKEVKVAQAGGSYHQDKEKSLIIATRPIVVYRPSSLPQHSTVRGMVGAHENVHALDVESHHIDRVYHPARTELRAYNVGAVILNDALSTGDLSQDIVDEQALSTSLANELCQENNVDVNALLSPGIQEIKNEDSAALDLWLHNFIPMALFPDK
jgi:hypothetical protein